MILIEKKSSNPYFNIAAEEYVLKNRSEDVVMLWQNEPSIVIGKHQNTLTEVNRLFAEENQIPVIRRISGGGTVFHDKGNINYTVITTEERKDRLIDFKAYSQPILDFLKAYSIDAKFEGKNNLTIRGKKFSGNSAHVYKNRVMHHGTLLFNSDLYHLDEAIKPAKWNIEDKAVQSIRANVTNIKNHLSANMTIEDFKRDLIHFLVNYHHINVKQGFTHLDIENIEMLVEDKYATWNWNYGYSPKYTFKNNLDSYKVVMEVKNGIIQTIAIDGMNDTAELLKGILHQKKAVQLILNKNDFNHENISRIIKLLGL